MKYITINNIQYYTRREPNGYGFQLMSIIKLDEKRKKYKLVFSSFDKEKIKSVFDEIEKTNVLSVAFPDTSEELPPLKILVYKSKHFTHYYNVSTYDKLIKTYRHILKENQIYYYNPRKLANETGISCIEDLDKIQIEQVRNDIAKKWDNYQEKIKQHTIEQLEWKNLQESINGEGNPIDAMEYYENNNYDIEDVEEIKNI